MRYLLTPLLLSVVSAGAAAHEGHGFSGVHWHASDLVGPAALLAIVAAALWWARRK